MNKNMFQFPISYSDGLPRIAAGWGVHETTADECKAAKIKHAMIVTTGLKGSGIVEEIKSSLNYHGISTTVFDKVTSNPKDYQVMAAYELLKKEQCDGLVSIGGGSSHDCAKMTRVVAANGGKDIDSFVAYLNPPWMEEIKKFKPCTLPQIAVNTTAGTGAEVTFLAALTNTKLKAKQLVVAPQMMPTVAIIDPLLIRQMPKKFAAWTGFDALAHAFETFISRVQSPFTCGISIRAIKIIAANLREFVNNRMNHVACENMAWAATMGGLCMELGSGAGIVHGIGHQISALADSHHGLSNAVMSLAGERYNQATCQEKFAEMAQAMGVDIRGMTVVQASDKWFDEIERLLKDLDIQPGNLNKQFGVKKEDLPHMVNIFSNDFSVEGNPREYNYDEIIKMLEGIL